MSWYAASIILTTRFKAGGQAKVPVWENVVLIEAESAAEALQKAEQRGRAEEGDAAGTYTYEGRPATLIFAGVRKLITCQDEHERPGDGTEVSYSQMEVASEDALQKLVQGEPVAVLYEE